MPRGGRRPGAGAKPKPESAKIRTVQVRVAERYLEALPHRLIEGDPRSKRALVEAGLRALAHLAPGGRLEWEQQPDGVWLALVCWLGPRDDPHLGAAIAAYVDSVEHGFAVLGGQGQKIRLRSWPNEGEKLAVLQRTLESMAWSWW